jgi:hypothetical protein
MLFKHLNLNLMLTLTPEHADTDVALPAYERPFVFPVHVLHLHAPSGPWAWAAHCCVDATSTSLPDSIGPNIVSDVL